MGEMECVGTGKFFKTGKWGSLPIPSPVEGNGMGRSRHGEIFQMRYIEKEGKERVHMERSTHGEVL